MMNERFIPVRVDLEYAIPKGAMVIGKQYDFNYECLLVVCDAEGNAVRDDISGRMCFSETVQPDWFISYLEQAAAKAMGSANGGAKDFFSDME